MDGTFSIFVENMLDYAVQRQQMLSSNIANQDTPGYKAGDLLFEDALAASLQPTATQPGHLRVPPPASGMRLVQSDRQDKGNGNNVQIEHEMTELTNTLISLNRALHLNAME